MKISTRPFKLLLPLLLVFGIEPGFWELFIDPTNNTFLTQYNLAALGICLGAAIWYWRRMEPTVSWGLRLTAAYFLGLMLESYATHGTWLVYMHVFSKVLVLFVMYGIYGYYRTRGLPPMKPLVSILFVVLLLNLALVHPEALSLKSFLDNERGFSASSALMLVLPTLLCLNWYLQRGSLIVLGTFFVGLAMIVFLQHRSVWITTLIALPVNLLLLWRRVPTVHFSLHRLALLIILPLAITTVGGLATVLKNPDVVKKFESNFEDITKPDKRGTGSWRFKQMEAYRPLVAQRPLLGWRLEGFEVPMQFYDPSSNQPMWPDGTGHHFHSFYMDRMFYFGWLGVLLAVVLPFIQVIRRIGHPAPFTAEACALIGLLAGSLVFGLSYDWPTHLYALIGLLLATTALPLAEPAELLLADQPEPVSESVLAA